MQKIPEAKATKVKPPEVEAEAAHVKQQQNLLENILERLYLISNMLL